MSVSASDCVVEVVWPQQSSHIISSLFQMLTNEEMCDIELVCGSDSDHFVSDSTPPSTTTTDSAYIVSMPTAHLLDETAHTFSQPTEIASHTTASNDVTLTTPAPHHSPSGSCERRLRAHRLVLAACSEYFSQHTADLSVCRLDLVCPGLHCTQLYRSLAHIVGIVYTGSVHIPSTQLACTLNVARYFCFTHVSALLEAKLDVAGLQEFSPTPLVGCVPHCASPLSVSPPHTCPTSLPVASPVSYSLYTEATTTPPHSTEHQSALSQLLKHEQQQLGSLPPPDVSSGSSHVDASQAAQASSEMRHLICPNISPPTIFDTLNLGDFSLTSGDDLPAPYSDDRHAHLLSGAPLVRVRSEFDFQCPWRHSQDPLDGVARDSTDVVALTDYVPEVGPHCLRSEECDHSDSSDSFLIDNDSTSAAICSLQPVDYLDKSHDCTDSQISPVSIVPMCPCVTHTPLCSAASDTVAATGDLMVSSCCMDGVETVTYTTSCEIVSPSGNINVPPTYLLDTPTSLIAPPTNCTSSIGCVSSVATLLADDSQLYSSQSDPIKYHIGSRKRRVSTSTSGDNYFSQVIPSPSSSVQAPSVTAKPLTRPSNPLFECQICLKSFARISKLQQHIRARHPLTEPCHTSHPASSASSSTSRVDASVADTVCTPRQQKLSGDGVVIAYDEDVGVFHCGAEECVYGASEHAESTVDLSSISEAAQYTKIPLLKCLECTFTAHTDHDIQLHTIRCHTNKHFACRPCSIKFSSRRKLYCHIRLKHLGSFDSLTECLLCEFKSSSSQTVCSHMESAHSITHHHVQFDLFLQCNQCLFATSNHCTLKQHVLSQHVSDKKFKCTQCAYTSITKQALDRHIRIKHSLDRPYRCDVCGFRSATLSRIARHRRVHTSEKPYECVCCHKQYADRRRLIEHMFVHRPDASRPQFACSLCGSVFKRKDNCVTHMSTKHGIKSTSLLKPMEHPT